MSKNKINVALENSKEDRFFFLHSHDGYSSPEDLEFQIKELEDKIESLDKKDPTSELIKELTIAKQELAEINKDYDRLVKESSSIKEEGIDLKKTKDLIDKLKLLKEELSKKEVSGSDVKLTESASIEEILAILERIKTGKEDKNTYAGLFEELSESLAIFNKMFSLSSAFLSEIWEPVKRIAPYEDISKYFEEGNLAKAYIEIITKVLLEVNKVAKYEEGMYIHDCKEPEDSDAFYLRYIIKNINSLLDGSKVSTKDEATRIVKESAVSSVQQKLYYSVENREWISEEASKYIKEISELREILRILIGDEVDQLTIYEVLYRILEILESIQKSNAISMARLVPHKKVIKRRDSQNMPRTDFLMENGFIYFVENVLTYKGVDYKPEQVLAVNYSEERYKSLFPDNKGRSILSTISSLYYIQKISTEGELVKSVPFISSIPATSITSDENGNIYVLSTDLLKFDKDLNLIWYKRLNSFYKTITGYKEEVGSSFKDKHKGIKMYVEGNNIHIMGLSNMCRYDLDGNKVMNKDIITPKWSSTTENDIAELDTLPDNGIGYKIPQLEGQLYHIATTQKDKEEKVPFEYSRITALKADKTLLSFAVFKDSYLVFDSNRTVYKVSFSGEILSTKELKEDIMQVYNIEGVNIFEFAQGSDSKLSIMDEDANVIKTVESESSTTNKLKIFVNMVGLKPNPVIIKDTQGKIAFKSTIIDKDLNVTRIPFAQFAPHPITGSRDSFDLSIDRIQKTTLKDHVLTMGDKFYKKEGSIVLRSELDFDLNKMVGLSKVNEKIFYVSFKDLVIPYNSGVIFSLDKNSANQIYNSSSLIKPREAIKTEKVSSINSGNGNVYIGLEDGSVKAIGLNGKIDKTFKITSSKILSCVESPDSKKIYALTSDSIFVYDKAESKSTSFKVEGAANGHLVLSDLASYFINKDTGKISKVGNTALTDTGITVGKVKHIYQNKDHFIVCSGNTVNYLKPDVKKLNRYQLSVNNLSLAATDRAGYIYAVDNSKTLHKYSSTTKKMYSKKLEINAESIDNLAINERGDIVIAGKRTGVDQSNIAVFKQEYVGETATLKKDITRNS